MALGHWLAFAAASAAILIIPGPTVLLVISYALGHGRKPAAAIVAGVVLGDLTAMTASILGLGAILATSAVIFTAMRWIGGGYLIYLGVKLWRAPVTESPSEDAPTASPFRMFAHAYAVTTLNPKSLIFFIAFVPQFIVTAQPFLPQVVVLEATFVVLAGLNAAVFAIMASGARGAIRRSGVRRALNKAGGGLLMGAGLVAAGWRKAA